MTRTALGLAVLVAMSNWMGGCDEKKSAIRYTLADNPTSRSGRGEPSTDDERRPAAWILVDNKEGAFRTDEKTQVPQLEMYIEDPVSARPTLRLEVLPELLGKSVGANFWLESVNLATGESVRYALAGQPGIFRMGQTYALSNPGEALVVRKFPADAGEAAIVSGIDELPPGNYLLAASVKGDKQIEVLAASRFTVGP